ncbi:unnamed protein product [Pedinophyceae sp. YPF-701]|nr:unnamed protein product [Pedinophyceae sp. YPF-701]
MWPWSKSSEPETSVLKDSRKKCWEARDSYYRCCEELGDSEDARSCSSERKLYEALCRASWVAHWDQARERDAKYSRVLARNIRQGQRTGSLRGVQEGRNQQVEDDL